MSDEQRHTARQLDLDDLTEKVKELVDNPVNVYAVAATIESIGIREVDVRDDFGFDTVFDLADHLYDRIKKEAGKEKAETDTGPGIKKGIWHSLKFFFKYYGNGLLFSLPVFSQIAAVLIFRYSLWAWIEFNEAQATVVAFGTIMAFVVTGGFIQTMGKSVSNHMSKDNYQSAYVATRNITKWGAIVLVLLAGLLYLLNIVIPFYPQPMILLALVYLILIGLLMLTSGILYALKQRVMILVGILVGTAFVIVGMDFLDLGIYISQWVGMGISIGILAAYGYLYLKLKIRFSRQELKEQVLPEPEIQYFSGYRYFVFGFCYFLFLFLDRLLAWSAGPPPPPYLVWFNTPYELGMDWALLTLILTIAVLEYSIHAFSRMLMPLQKNSKFIDIDRFNRFFKSFYLKQVLILMVVGGISITITYYGINSLKVLQDQVPEIRDFFANPMTTEVFWIASVSYLLLILGLLHSLFFFTLNRPSYVMYAMIAAVVVNFVVGYICSRVLSLEYATIGLFAGSLTFALITGWMAKRFFERLDYYYYSAF